MIQAIISRLTPRRLGDAVPTAAELEQAILAACAAPDHGRLKPWRFLVVEGAARARLGEVMAEALKLRDSSATEFELQREREKPLRAPLIVAIACVPQPSPKVPALEQLMAVSAAAQNFQLAIHALGFGCQWKTGPAVYDETVKAALDLRPKDYLVGLMYVGSIAEAGQPRDVDVAKVMRRWV